MTEDRKSKASREYLPRIAVVDDDGSFLRSIGRLLRCAGFPVKTFGSGQEFLESLPASAPECLVVDVHMPVMTGPELHDQLRARGATFPVVFVTAYDTPQTLEHVAQTGSKLVMKPFNREMLLTAIQQALGSSFPLWSRPQVNQPPSDAHA